MHYTRHLPKCDWSGVRKVAIERPLLMKLNTNYHCISKPCIIIARNYYARFTYTKVESFAP